VVGRPTTAGSMSACRAEGIYRGIIQGKKEMRRVYVIEMR
jgi:hypothetical protein